MATKINKMVAKNYKNTCKTIHLKYTHIAKLPDFIGVQQLHSSCAFVEVVFEGGAASPVLDLAAARQETDGERRRAQPTNPLYYLHKDSLCQLSGKP